MYLSSRSFGIHRSVDETFGSGQVGLEISLLEGFVGLLVTFKMAKDDFSSHDLT
jgi:hypothetical protein